jgi:beta-lactamase class A
MLGRIALSIVPFLLLASFAKAQSPDARIAALENVGKTRIGVVAVDSNSGGRIEHRANERFAMCSTFKLLAVAAVLQRVDQGKENLDRFVPYTEKDLLEYAPVTSQHVREGGMTLRGLCEAAIEQSDNTAANLVLQIIAARRV